MGRPKKTEKRDRQLNISFTEAEFETVTSRAFRRGVAAVDYGRAMLLGGEAGAPSVQPALPRFDHLAVLQLQRLGNLLNQLVRHVHQTGHLPIDELVSLLRDIRAALGRALP